VARDSTVRVGDRVVYFSWRDYKAKGVTLQKSWNAARSFCRRRCMDLARLDKEDVGEEVARSVHGGGVFGAWTAGRYCPSGDCKGKDGQKGEYGGDDDDLRSRWRWVSKEDGETPVGSRFWSNKGGMDRKQPDNLLETLYEDKKGEREECLAVLNDWYDDGVAWHDMPCVERLPFVCEKSVSDDGQYGKN